MGINFHTTLPNLPWPNTGGYNSGGHDFKGIIGKIGGGKGGKIGIPNDPKPYPMPIVIPFSGGVNSIDLSGYNLTGTKPGPKGGFNGGPIKFGGGANDHWGSPNMPYGHAPIKGGKGGGSKDWQKIWPVTNMTGNLWGGWGINKPSYPNASIYH
jgi:hypothetical protein